MKIKEESSFLQGVESRLDSLFAEDTQPLEVKDTPPPVEKDSQPFVVEDSDPPQAAATELAPGMEEVQETPEITETSVKSEVLSEPIPSQDKSSFISEIEKRFSAIFGEDDKDVQVTAETAGQAELKSIIAEAEPKEIKPIDLSLEDLPSPPSSVLHSPLKDMKSIILSIEWEINDTILEQLDDEINKLYLMYTGDRIIQGFLRILRFLGRYVRVRGVHSNQDSINLLLFIYDHLENVMVSEGMTEAKKHITIIDSIKRYRAWVESTDLEAPKEAAVPETEAGEVESPIPELRREQFFEDRIAEQKTVPDIQPTFEPLVEAPIERVIEESSFPRPWEEEERVADIVKEPEIVFSGPPTLTEEIAPPTRDADVEKTVAAMQELPPHEAFIYALEEFKKMFQSELDALKEEVQVLKNAR